MSEGDPNVVDWQTWEDWSGAEPEPPAGLMPAGPWYPFAAVSVARGEEATLCACVIYRRPLRSVPHVETSPRGFPIYGRVPCNEGTIRVKRSSGIDAAVWLFSDFPRKVTIGDEKFVPEPSLDVDQARAMIAALQAFVDDVGEK